jgi:NADH-quinone oxidoreductase subunit G
MSVKRLSLTIDGQAVEAKEGERLIDVAKNIGVNIPRFCYHPDLSVVASCRMCLVDVEGINKPMPSCSTIVSEGMVVNTKNEKSVDAQKAVMRFLLMKHPLHCPICDQGGQCELQDVAMGYGDGITDYSESKRDVEDENLGPLVATDMSLCIHCTRCVRFGEEIAGIKELGLMGRSDDAKISTYLSKGVQSEWSGNMIDLCPVGALTSKPAKFSGRAWSYKGHPSIAAHDCVAANVQLHTSFKGYQGIHEIKEVVPRQSDALNHIWLSDRDRFSYQAVGHARVKSPMQKVGEHWEEITYEQAFMRISEAIARLSSSEKNRSLVAVSPQTTSEVGVLLADYFRKVGINHIDIANHEALYTEDIAYLPATALPSDIEEADTVIMLGSALRWDQPYLSLRVKKAQENGAKVFSMGALKHQYTYPVEHHMLRSQDLIRSSMIFLNEWQNSTVIPKHWLPNLVDKKVVLLVGEESLIHPDAVKLNQALAFFAKEHGFRYALLPQGVNSLGLYQSGCMPFVKGYLGQKWQDVTKQHLNFLWLMQLDPVKDLGLNIEKLHSTFVVACVSHLSDEIKASATIILPNSLPVEQSGSYCNYYGLEQPFNQVVKASFLPVDQMLHQLATYQQIELNTNQSWTIAPREDIHRPEVVEGLSGKYILTLTHWIDADIWLRNAQALQQAYPIVEGALVSNENEASNLQYLISDAVAKDTTVVYRNTKTHAMIKRASNKREDRC